MKRRKARDPSGRRRPVSPFEGTKALLTELGQDPRYLALKQQLGEVLTPSERAVLEAASGAAPPPLPTAPTEGGEP